ncbi:glycoside hydrolase [Variovorax paradoxus]|uniref:WD40/YVTN/BNR-like repeat-containing protein n=1 Tax=Variovorax paradoxus TaxID=34073 RepID=UPI0021ABE47F|nr:sialidase family protein [Variovorax paradoxus]UVH58471.1 glycoside hydrolase [Variovorax paradoxus]
MPHAQPPTHAPSKSAPSAAARRGRRRRSRNIASLSILPKNENEESSVRPSAPLIQRVLRYLSFLAACAVLVACTTAPIASQQTLTGQEGAVVLKLITNSPGENDPAESLSSLHLERVLAPGEKQTGRDLVTLVRTRQATYTTAVFSGMVNPGRYVIKNAMGGQGNMVYTFPIDAKFGSFDVVKGEVTLLGTLLIQPRMGTRFFIAYVPPEEELQKSFETLYPALASQTRGRPTHGFTPTADLERRAALTSESKRRASLWNGLVQTADGEFMAGSKLGKVLWRKAGTTRWKELDVGTWREVLSVRPFRGGLLAAGEEGLLRLSTDEGLSWKQFAPPDDGLIQLAQPMSDGSVVVFSRSDRLWSAYVSEDLDAGKWRKLGEFPDTQSINVPWKRTMVVGLPNAAGVMMPNGDLHMTDGKTVTRVSNGQSTLDVNALPDGTLVSQTVLMTKSTLLSKDVGKTWTDLNTSRFVVTIAFKDSKTAYAVSPIAPGVFPGPLGLMTTRDGGKSWAHTGSSPGLTGPYAVRQMMVDRSDGSLLAFLPDNAIVRSADEGKTWRIVKDD